MKKLTMLLLMGLALSSQALYAGELSYKSNFWEQLRYKLDLLTPKYKVTLSRATGGVRGAPMASEDMYWKGDASAQSVDSDELEAFKKAAALIELGDKNQAQTAFSEFIKEYPESSLRKDADQALALSKP